MRIESWQRNNGDGCGDGCGISNDVSDDVRRRLFES